MKFPFQKSLKDPMKRSQVFLFLAVMIAAVFFTAGTVEAKPSKLGFKGKAEMLSSTVSDIPKNEETGANQNSYTEGSQEDVLTYYMIFKNENEILCTITDTTWKVPVDNPKVRTKVILAQAQAKMESGLPFLDGYVINWVNTDSDEIEITKDEFPIEIICAKRWQQARRYRMAYSIDGQILHTATDEKWRVSVLDPYLSKTSALKQAKEKAVGVDALKGYKIVEVLEYSDPIRIKNDNQLLWVKCEAEELNELQYKIEYRLRCGDLLYTAEESYWTVPIENPWVRTIDILSIAQFKASNTEELQGYKVSSVHTRSYRIKIKENGQVIKVRCKPIN